MKNSKVVNNNNNNNNNNSNEMHKILWNFELQTDALISAGRPDLMIVNKRKNKQRKKKQKQKRREPAK